MKNQFVVAVITLPWGCTMTVMSEVTGHVVPISLALNEIQTMVWPEMLHLEIMYTL